MAKMIFPSRDRASVSQSINAGSIQELLFGPSLTIDEDCNPSVDACRNILHIYLKSTSVSGRCPCCGAVSSAVNCAAFRHPPVDAGKRDDYLCAYHTETILL